ncbi:MAG: hypothetical protein Q9180_007206 [Flavoplaca navasiana]
MEMHILPLVFSTAPRINGGIMFALMVIYCTLYLLATEYISLQPSRGEVLLFRDRPSRPPAQDDEEAEGADSVRDDSDAISTVKDELTHERCHSATFIWDNLSYEINVKKEKKRILSEVEGYIKPGTMTALMASLFIQSQE